MFEQRLAWYSIAIWNLKIRTVYAVTNQRNVINYITTTHGKRNKRKRVVVEIEIIIVIANDIGLIIKIKRLI